jgi:hypothetical protein
MFDLLANLFSHEEELSQVVPVIKAEDTISEVCSSGDEVFSMPPRFVRKTSNHVCVPDVSFYTFCHTRGKGNTFLG